MINISLWLYGKPSWDLDIEGEENFDPKLIREQGEFLKEHLENTANIIEKLKSFGWNCYPTTYTIELSKYRISKKEAKNELKFLGINTNYIKLKEFEELSETEA